MARPLLLLRRRRVAVPLLLLRRRELLRRLRLLLLRPALLRLRSLGLRGLRLELRRGVGLRGLRVRLRCALRRHPVLAGRDLAGLTVRPGLPRLPVGARLTVGLARGRVAALLRRRG